MLLARLTMSSRFFASSATTQCTPQTADNLRPVARFGVIATTGGFGRSRATRSAVELTLPSPSPLSARELEVLELAARALSNAQIATQLFIAAGTVKRHLTNIYAKLGAVSRLDAVNRARAAGLIQLPDDSGEITRALPQA